MNLNSNILDKFKKLILNEKSGRYLFLIGISLIILVYFISGINKDNTKTVQADVNAEYSEQLENKIEEIVNDITGAKSKVLVTLNSDGETVYADQINTTVDTTENTESHSTKIQKSDDTEHNYIIIEQADGTQEALIVTKINPTVKGVAIVVKNANQEIKDKISEAVTTALDISSSKVCVISS